MSPGSTASARAIATRLRMPPDSSPGSWSSVPASSTCSRTRRVMAAISAGAWGPRSRRRKPTFSATVSEARSAEDWKTMAMRKGFSSGGRARYSPSSIPPTVMRPASGRSRPTICRSSTDFPVPLWPTMASSSPGATRRSTPASTTCSPYAFRTPASSTETPCRRSAAGLAILGGCRGNHGGCGERSGGCERRARSSLLRRTFTHASSVVAALAALAPRLVRLAHHDYPDRLLGRDRQDAAVDAERAAGDPARVRRGEEDDQPGDVGGLAHASGRDRAPAECLGEHLVDRPPGRRSARARRLLDRLGADEAGHDAVREDAVLREGVGQALREVDERRLGGGVGREERVGLAADARGDVDDAPAALRAHERHAGERETDGAHEVEREARLPVGLGELEEPPGRAPAGVVDQHVDAAEARHGPLDDELPAGLGGDVGGDRLDPPAAGADLTGDRLQRLAAARVDRQVRARP